MSVYTLFSRIVLTFFSILGLSSISSAQNVFEGFYGQVGIGYERSDSSNTNVGASTNSSSYTLSPTGTNPHRTNFAGAIGLGYYASVNSQFLIGLGAEYEPLSQNTSSYTVASPGQPSQGGSYKISNRYNIFISPGFTVNKNGLAYAKLGYTGQTLKGNDGFLSGLPNQNQSGYSVGLGYRQALSTNLYGFIEANYFSYSKSNASFSSGLNTYSVNPSTYVYNGLVGIGYRF